MKTKEAIISDLAACKNAFDQADLPWVVTGGTVLGYARYNDIMDWDNDLDIGIFVELTNEQWQRLYKVMRSHGFRLKNRKIDFIYGKRNIKFNLWIFHKNGDYYEAFPRSTLGFKFVVKAEWYDEPQAINFLGDTYFMPNHMEDYLCCCYGEDWKTNVKKHEEYIEEKRGGGRDIKSVWQSRRNRKDGKLWWPVCLKIDENIKDLL